MRRSGAPSQRGFQPPLKKTKLTPNETNVPMDSQKTANLSNSDRDFMSELGIILFQESPSSQEGIIARTPQSLPDEEASKAKCSPDTSFTDEHGRRRKPVFKLQHPSATRKQNGGVSKQTNSDHHAAIQTSYYSVMWCKLSKKKHKKWEGDAVLVIRGRSVILQDLEGKDIGRSSSYKLSELAKLTEGQTLIIGGKEIEVMGVISDTEYVSGKCFTAAGPAVNDGTVVTTRPVVAAKPFVRPQKNKSEQSGIQSTTVPVVQPRHDPNHAEAVVMTRPPTSVLRDHNQRNLPIVDVVLDPRLTHHLRPHQKVGVTFLYECVLGYRQYNGTGAILARCHCSCEQNCRCVVPVRGTGSNGISPSPFYSDDMGLGKTLQCITLICPIPVFNSCYETNSAGKSVKQFGRLSVVTKALTLLKQGPYGGKPVIRRAIVITPSSLVKNWRAEFRKWLGDERISVYAVGQDRKIDDYLISKLYPVLIISYEMFVKLHHCLQDVLFDLIVCDEGHRLKNSSIKTTSLISSLSCNRRIVLSGTPVQNDLQEFYSIVDFCNPGVLGTANSFHRIYEVPILASRQPNANSDDVTMGESRGAALAELTDLFILRRTSDINNEYLPPKTEIVLFCRPTELQLALYRALLASHVFRECLLATAESTGPLVCIDALKKLCNHPDLLYQKVMDDGATIGETEGSLYLALSSLYPDDFISTRESSKHSGKLTVMERLLTDVHDSGERVVLVSNYTKTLSIIQSLCEKKKYKFLRLDGQTPTAKRQELVQRFNAKYSDISVFLLSSKAGGTGLNLIGASRLVLYDIDWNPATDLQAMARVWRDGQRRHVRIYRLLTTGTIEEKIYQRQICKQSLSGIVVGKGGAKSVHFSQEDLKDLFTLRDDCRCDTHELLACGCPGDGQKSENDGFHGGETGTEVNEPISDKSKQNLSMVELLSWHHADGCHLDEILDNASSLENLVTYAFWNESNMPQAV